MRPRVSLLGSIVQAAFEAEAARAQVQSAKAGDVIQTRPLLKARIWGTRGRLGIFYVVETPKVLTPSPSPTPRERGAREREGSAPGAKDEGERAFSSRAEARG